MFKISVQTKKTHWSGNVYKSENVYKLENVYSENDRSGIRCSENARGAHIVIKIKLRVLGNLFHSVSFPTRH